MTIQFIMEPANIDECPLAMKIQDTAVSDITIGDLHGNAIKLMYFLVRQSIISISDLQYLRLVEIYKTHQQELTAALLLEFKSIVHSLCVINHGILIRLIGDELGDRGANDYYVLEILHKLSKENCPMEILLSNHGAEFVEAYERFRERKNKFKVSRMGGFAKSLKALSELVARGLVDSDYILAITEMAYKPQLKLLSYSLDLRTNAITIYSHAGIGLSAIFLLAIKFHVQFSDKTSFELAATIEAINAAFSMYVCNNQLHTIFNDEAMYQGFGGSIQLNIDTCLEFILWNRRYEELDRYQFHNGYSINFVHGHDADDDTVNNIYNLDDLLGKSLDLHNHTYTVLASDEVKLSHGEFLMAAKEATFSQQPESSNSRTRNGELLESAEKSDTPTIKTNACGFFFTFCHKNAPDIEGAEVFSRVDITDNSL